MRDFEEMKKFWDLLPKLEKNEVYVMLLIGKRNQKRQILDTVLIKSNDFDEFFNKTALLLNKAKRLPFETELLFDVNKKDVVIGLQDGFVEIRLKMARKEDLRNFFSIFLRHIRYAQITNFTLIKANELLPEVEPFYVVYDGEKYYHILDRDCDDCITKPEIPIPGTRPEIKIVYSAKNL